MPPKTITCSVCSQSVLKAQTLARADGSRACRSHDGVTAEAEKLAEAEISRREKAIRNAGRPSWADDRDHMVGMRAAGFEQQAAEFREYIYSHCWTCNEEGLEAHGFFTQALIASKRLELRGEFNFLSYGHDVRTLMGNIRLLTPIKLEDKVVDRAITKHVNKRVRDILHLLGFVLICPECARKHGFGERLDAMMPKPTWEQIEAMAPITAAIDPLVTAMAEKKEKQS